MPQGVGILNLYTREDEWVGAEQGLHVLRLIFMTVNGE